MKISQLFENAIDTDDNSESYENILTRIYNSIKGATGVNISGQWLAGFLNQIKDYRYFDDKIQTFQKMNDSIKEKDTMARKIARDVLVKMGLLKFDKAKKIYKFTDNNLISQMRQYYTKNIHRAREQNDPTTSTRIAGDNESQDWINKLSEKQRNWVQNLQELNPEELAEFKGIVSAKESKRGFFERLYNFAENNELAQELLSNMGLIVENGLNLPEIVEFRNFLNSLSNERLKDVLSKSVIYQGKKISHDNVRARNAVLKGMEKSSHGRYSRALKIYNYVSRRLKTGSKQEFDALLKRLPMTTDSDNELNAIGLGARALFDAFQGKLVDKSSVKSAINTLNDMYITSATRNRRSAKAVTRGNELSKLGDI